MPECQKAKNEAKQAGEKPQKSQRAALPQGDQVTKGGTSTGCRCPPWWDRQRKGGAKHVAGRIPCKFCCSLTAVTRGRGPISPRSDQVPTEEPP